MSEEPHLFASPPPLYTSRRQFLSITGSGLGLLALTALLDQQSLLAQRLETRTANVVNPMSPKQPMFPARAKSVIWLFMNGGPSQVDTWDYKPQLEKHDKQELQGFDQNTGFFTDQVGPIMKSPFAFR